MRDTRSIAARAKTSPSAPASRGTMKEIGLIGNFSCVLPCIEKINPKNKLNKADFELNKK
jgi:hypothetical protein